MVRDEKENGKVGINNSYGCGEFVEIKNLGRCLGLGEGWNGKKLGVFRYPKNRFN